ncbi:MAG: Crp/Fnr family transcriptional regulator [Eubacterium sp.]|nr:Crp/Fnr family transcriptional regulator [Eubacterium sp.]
MQIYDPIDIISKGRLFHGMDKDEILGFTRDFPQRIIEYQHNDCIITKDESPEAIGIVLEGTLGIYTDSFYGGHTLIGIGDQDYLFGFIARFYNASKSITTLYCRKRCKVAYFKVSREMTALSFIKQVNPKVLSNIYAMLTKHIGDDFDRMHIISSSSVQVRLARYLLYLNTRTGKLKFDILFNRTELADFLGVYRTSLSRILNGLCKERIITLNKTRVEIMDLDRHIRIELESYRE